MAENIRDTEIQMEVSNLYREDSFTDRRVGTLQKLTPIRTDGSPDNARAEIYVGQTQILTPAGALPLSFEVEAASLEEAVAKFGENAKTALADAMQRLEELRREAASSIIVPGAEPGAGSGNMPGGGFQMP